MAKRQLKIKGSGTYEKRAGLQFEQVMISKDVQFAALGVVAVIVFGGAGWFIYKKYRKSKLATDLQKVISDTKVDTTKTTITEMQALDFANRLFLAMDSNGTDETVIKSILIDRNLAADDIKLIVKKFGIKPYGISGSPSVWSFGTKRDLDLMGWLCEELSESWLKQIRPKFNAAGFNL